MFFFSLPQDKILIAFKNRVISFRQAKIENNVPKECLPPALLSIKWIFYRWGRRNMGR